MVLVVFVAVRATRARRPSRALGRTLCRVPQPGEGTSQTLRPDAVGPGRPRPETHEDTKFEKQLEVSSSKKIKARIYY